MPYIQTVADADATGLLRELYDAELKASGFVANSTQILSLHPEVIAAWQQLTRTIHAHVRLRRYELVTYATALALKCHY